MSGTGVRRWLSVVQPDSGMAGADGRGPVSGGGGLAAFDQFAAGDLRAGMFSRSDVRGEVRLGRQIRAGIDLGSRTISQRLRAGARSHIGRSRSAERVPRGGDRVGPRWLGLCRCLVARGVCGHGVRLASGAGRFTGERRPFVSVGPVRSWAADRSLEAAGGGLPTRGEAWRGSHSHRTAEPV